MYLLREAFTRLPLRMWAFPPPKLLVRLLMLPSALNGDTFRFTPTLLSPSSRSPASSVTWIGDGRSGAGAGNFRVNPLEYPRIGADLSARDSANQRRGR